MIRGVHAMFYTSEPEALRAFLRDKLGFPSTDVGDGWLIFDMPDAEMGCHPAGGEHGARSGTHYISFYCDDIHASMADLERRGVEFVDDVQDHGYGLVTRFKVPGDFTIELYQPKYARNPTPKRSSAPRKPGGARKPAASKKSPASRKSASPRKARRGRGK